MNITDFIVTYLQQGKNVEIPGVGTLTPIGQQITLRNTYCNDKSIVKYIAEKECVSESIAEMMWKNYVDALTDKLQHSGSHEFEGAGVMTFSNGTFGFTTAKAAPTIEETLDAQVIGNVKKYTKNDDEDPFAVFDQPIREEVAQPVVEAPKPVEEKPTYVAPKVEMREEPKPVVETPKVEEKSIETPQVEKETSKAEPVEEKVESSAPTVEEHYEEMKVDEQQVADDKEEKVAKAQAAKEAHLKAKQEKAEAKRQKKEAKHLKKEKKRKKKAWLIVLLILLLLACGAGAYYYFVYMPSQQPKALAEPIESIEVPVNNEFTTNMDLIEYSEEERFDEAVALTAMMEQYVGQYLARRGYSAAKDEMMNRVQTYALSRFDTLLSTDTYSVRRFIPYEDYLYNAFYPVMKNRKASQSRCVIVEELMNYGMLRELLEAMVLELGLQSDLKAVPVAKAQEPALPKVSTEHKSKQGFDAIAGFYTNYSSAVRMTASLKKWGCDAYVIEKNSGYYVSMGSANTRTAAEALVKHIKSWYDGDVVIKQID